MYFTVRQRTYISAPKDHLLYVLPKGLSDEKTTVHQFERQHPQIPRIRQAIIYGDLIFISAQPPVNPETGEVDSGDVKAQTRRILTNVSGILEDAGTSLDNMLKVTVFLKDRSLFSDFNDAYAGFFPENPPARSPVFTDTGDYLVTMDFIAGMD